MEETYALTTLVRPVEGNTKDFEETPNDDEATLSNENRRAMDVAERTIKCVDNFKLHIAVPLRQRQL